jgi:nucleoside-diphosphate-sugar epimerase
VIFIRALSAIQDPFGLRSRRKWALPSEVPVRSGLERFVALAQSLRWVHRTDGHIVNRTALIAGASGIVGRNLARHLADRGWSVIGLARRPPTGTPGVQACAANLLDQTELNAALSGLRPSHVFITTWMRQETEAQNIAVNSQIVRNLLDAVSPAQSVAHVALVTGLKHYLGPFEMYGKGTLPVTPFREESGRLNVENFYYAQEDEVFAAARRDGFTWSVHRPHTIIGFAVGNAMNMGSTLAAYATLCREFKRPFLFPGSAVQWLGLTDMTDARLLARHLEWGSTAEAARNQDFNVVNGDVFRWNWMWARVANWFGLTPAPFPGTGVPLETQMADAAPLWAEIVDRYQLSEPHLAKLASAWHTDADLGRPIEAVTDMSKSRKLGFLDYQATDQSFFDLFEQMRLARLIP